MLKYSMVYVIKNTYIPLNLKKINCVENIFLIWLQVWTLIQLFSFLKFLYSKFNFFLDLVKLWYLWIQFVQLLNDTTGSQINMINYNDFLISFKFSLALKAWGFSVFRLMARKENRLYVTIIMMSIINKNSNNKIIIYNNKCSKFYGFENKI